MRHFVSCSEKKSIFGRAYQVSAIGGSRTNGSIWCLTEKEAIREIEAGETTYCINVEGLVRNLTVGILGLTKFLTTETESDLPHALLQLPDFAESTRSDEGAVRVA